MKSEVRQQTVQEWAARLQRAADGRWTLGLVRDLEAWLSRRHGELTFHLTQMLTGHRCFNGYLNRWNKVPSRCSLRPAENDDAQYTIFGCTAWDDAREELEASIGSRVTPEMMVEVMLASSQNWSAMSKFADRVMRAKEDAERVRQRTVSAYLTQPAQQVASDESE